MVMIKMNKAAIVFSQNLKLESLRNLNKVIEKYDSIVFLTTHYLFDYERKKIDYIIGKRAAYYSFIDFISIQEMRRCDVDAYLLKPDDITQYDSYIKELKNKIILSHFESAIQPDIKIIMSDDLGIDKEIWLKNGYTYYEGRYYYYAKKNLIDSIHQKITTFFTKRLKCVYKNVYVGYCSGKKYIFIGKMNRVRHHIGIEFKYSETDAINIANNKYEEKKNTIYLTSIHESYLVNVPEDDKYAVYQIQDGYIPPVYSYSYRFIPNNHIYLAWDIMGEKVFKSQNIPVMLMPFRKKIYMPKTKNIGTVKKVVIVASGAGDWTAMKNRSDEDYMVDAFVKVAALLHEVTFLYRCHPTWIHPNHQGVNSINRVAEYFSQAGNDNIMLSSNIPHATLNNFSLTYSRSSLAEDIKGADIVFGDHSVSMIDAAMEGTIFASINVMRRENLFRSMTELGFPCCKSVEEIVEFIESINNGSYKEKYDCAIDSYNKMIDEVD